MPTGVLKIGTSGIVLPGNKSTFPEEFRNASRLNYYSSLFNSLEINSSFYKLPLASTFAKWTDDVCGDFKFTVKLWRGITHAKNLQYAESDAINFMQAAGKLGSKAGCLLIQFPASINFNFATQVESLLTLLNRINNNSQWRMVVEFRHTSWYQNNTYKMLNDCNSSLVIHDMPNSRTPVDYEPDKLAYFRFHGPTGRYSGSYDDDFLSRYARQIKDWKKQGKDIYVYFNNTIGDALKNAQLLQRFIESKILE
ncbi:MAG: DUF72 domain-containing protein [Gammaproteobacteria bacterium]|nr:MAG: DUF72 domain-containing protein [Gammaproteobacteria bacterium]